jgi:hypothetical protein
LGQSGRRSERAGTNPSDTTVPRICRPGSPLPQIARACRAEQEIGPRRRILPGAGRQSLEINMLQRKLIAKPRPNPNRAADAGAGAPASSAASPKPPAEDNLLTPAQAAGQLGVSEGVLERWRGTGDGPRFARLSRKTIRYRTEDLAAFVENRVVSSTAAG